MPDYGFSALDRLPPGDDAGELEWLLFRQHGVISRRQALQYMSQGALERRVRSGRWRAAHRGVYVAHNGPITDHQRSWIAVLAVGSGRVALLGGLSALAVLGLRRFASRGIHVLIPAAKRDADPPPGVVVHRTRSLPPEDQHRVGDPPCTMPARSVVDAAKWAASDDEARTIVAVSFQQRLVGGDLVERVLARMPVVSRRALILRTARDAREGSETVTELDLVAVCRRGGLPTPSRQVVRTDKSGRKRYLDAYFDEWRLRVEIDGAHHMFVEEWWRDMDRHNSLSVREEALLRYPAWLVRDRPAKVADEIRAALLEAGWRPGM